MDWSLNDHVCLVKTILIQLFHWKLILYEEGIEFCLLFQIAEIWKKMQSLHSQQSILLMWQMTMQGQISVKIQSQFGSVKFLLVVRGDDLAYYYAFRIIPMSRGEVANPEAATCLSPKAMLVRIKIFMETSGFDPTTSST